MSEGLVAVKPEESIALQKVSTGLFKSGLFPNAKNEWGAFAIIEYGHELGIPPMMALKNINIISGQLACNAQLMLSLATSRGVTYQVLEESDTGAKIEFKRGQASYTASFTKKDAEAAGLLSKDNWKKYPRDMYFWRTVAKGIRRVAPDAVMGLYTADEISEGKYVDVVDVPVENVPTPTSTADPNEPEPEQDEPKEMTVQEQLHKELCDYCRFADGDVDEDMYRTVCTEISTFSGKNKKGETMVKSFDDALKEGISEKWAGAALGKLRKKLEAKDEVIDAEVE